MNIKSRLKKLQSQIIGIDSEFCCCANTRKFGTVYYENGKLAISAELLPNSANLVPDTCGECLKPISKTIIIVDFTDAESVAK